MAPRLGVGIIGCGNISAAYLRLAPLFRGIEMRACADIDMAVATARAGEFGVRAETVDALLRAEDIDIIVNLTSRLRISRSPAQPSKPASTSTRKSRSCFRWKTG
jgi:predicted dehydrogenase